MQYFHTRIIKVLNANDNTFNLDPLTHAIIHKSTNFVNSINFTSLFISRAAFMGKIHNANTVCPKI